MPCECECECECVVTVRACVRVKVEMGRALSKEAMGVGVVVVTVAVAVAVWTAGVSNPCGATSGARARHLRPRQVWSPRRTVCSPHRLSRSCTSRTGSSRSWQRRGHTTRRQTPRGAHTSRGTRRAHTMCPCCPRIFLHLRCRSWSTCDRRRTPTQRNQPQTWTRPDRSRTVGSGSHR